MLGLENMSMRMLLCFLNQQGSLAMAMVAESLATIVSLLPDQL